MTETRTNSRVKFAQWLLRPRTQWPILQAVIRCLYACVRLLVPTNARQVMFESLPDCSDNAYAIFESVMKSARARDFRLIWLVRNPDAAEQVLRRDYADRDLGNVKVFGKSSLRGLLCYLRSRYIFSTHNCYWFARSSFHQTIVNLTHGMPIKKMGEIEASSGICIRSRHHLCATSELFGDIVADCFKSRRERVLVTGLPRNDWLFEADERNSAVKSGRSKLVVWLPTFRRSHQENVWQDAAATAPDPLDTATLDALDKKLDAYSVALVIKLHPLDIKNLQSWPTFHNIHIYSDEEFRRQQLNLYKLLGASDALITDYSSVAIDYLLLNKPIGVFAPDMAVYSRGFMPEVLERFTSVTYELGSIEHLVEFVSNPPSGRSMIPEAQECYSADLRGSSQRVLKAVGLTALAAPSEAVGQIVPTERLAENAVENR